MKLVQINNGNLTLALETFHKIFSWIPAECDPYTDVVNNKMPELKARYYLVYDEDALVGITGFYVVPEDPESAFLGWFGVTPEMRRNHYGSKILALHEEELKSLGYKYSRLYTETENNEATRNFYEKNGYVGELYDCPQEPEQLKNTLVVYSKSLGNYPISPWNSRYMRIAEEATHMYSAETLENSAEVFEKMKTAKHE